jgi:hypothetical protein
MEMRDDEARLVYLRFALQCCDSPINRVHISVEEEETAIGLVSQGKLPERGFEKKFRQAYAVCTIIAKEMGKEEIDSEVVLRYFLQLHNPNLDRDLEMGYTFRDSVDCKTYPGKIKKIDDDSAVVDTPVGEIVCRRVFALDLKEGALVAVHRNTIAIPISEAMARTIEGTLKNDTREKLRGVF